MPATSPVTFEGSQTQSNGGSDVNESASLVTGNTEKFQLTYDKLVIAVGAYNQSAVPFLMSFAAHILTGMLSDSVQRPWGQGTRALPQRHQGRAEDPHADS